MIDEKKLIKELKRYDFSYMQRGDIQECLEEIIESQAKVGEWIPVDENLPIGGELVLITFEDSEVECAWFDTEYCRWNLRGYFIDDCEVIAWMPFPDAYEVEYETN